MSEKSKVPEASQDTESLLKRLAGPSTTKAGLAKDQTEINRVIAEASKGSKFYENEKRKDKELTEKITRILKQRDEVMKGVDIAQVEHGVDQIIAKMEAQRDLTQVIVHVDMDAFYASVELLDNPKLKGTIFAVGHGVLTTASYEARKYGIRSGMATYIAKKLYPDLVIIANNFSRYSEMSKQVMSIFRRYDSTMCAASVDEGYLNITKYCEEHGLTAEECVQQMRDTVQEESKLTVSAGIAPNKMLAKICSDKNKPNGQFLLDFQAAAIKDFMKDLPIRKVPGVGRVNERLLDSIGIKTCGDIFTNRATLSLMDKQFGLHFLLQTYLGIASNVVQPYQREERKSIGSERTFSTLSDKGRILAKLEEIAEELESDMTSSGWAGKTVTLKYKLDTYQVFTRAKALSRWVSSKDELFAIGKELIQPEFPLRLRLIGLRVTKLKDLKDNADAKPGGIKRFFTAADSSGASSSHASVSPRKKRKIETSEEDPTVPPGEPPSLSQDGFEEAMPGYHEHEYAEEHEPPNEDNEDIVEIDGSEVVQSPPRKRPVSTSSNIKAGEASSSKPLSITKPPSSKHKADTQSLTCPICNKVLQTDNDGLNKHIDFCLSKDAIRDASAASTSSSSGLKIKGPSTRKPFKLGKRKK